MSTKRGRGGVCGAPKRQCQNDDGVGSGTAAGSVAMPIAAVAELEAGGVISPELHEVIY